VDSKGGLLIAQPRVQSKSSQLRLLLLLLLLQLLPQLLLLRLRHAAYSAGRSHQRSW